ncbi:MAG: hypothetical protein KJ576_20885 [Proteobacteria bacterium]|nr:hypothetical protein [Pseudomonadota bacterium]
MAIYNGKDGAVKVTGSGTAAAIGEINTWSLSTKLELIETPEFGQKWKEFDAGLGEWTAQFEGSFDYADAEQKSLLDALIANSTGVMLTGADALQLHLNATTFFSGVCYIVGAEIKATHNDKATVAFSVQGSGAPAVTTS